ncbi:MAG: hypothetical protein OHK93_005490 [Ramalina farinacea]|uniref:Cyclopropane-fatty-acyl-phospholipid synthase n=1 Tax=Ramalina farinacea TaxID=258253 RepID=A0AA43QIH9_9LECA|nr:hypothetical protein [Ramalina farinacea]
MAMLSRPFDLLRTYVGSLTWAPFVQISRSTVLGLLQRIQQGQLRVTDCDGSVTLCGAILDGAPKTELKVLKEAFWVRVLLFADMLFILNRAELSNATTLTSSLASTITGLARRTNTLANARLNISAHYDISNSMFAAFLSEDMTYSCPIWAPTSSPKSVGESLEEAQERKLQYFIEHAKIKRTDHVLEIGTGWGSFAIAAVRRTGCRVTSLTLSREQKELADERIAEAGFTENVEVLLCDYRALPMPNEGPYDKVVSIEMLEAVGREYLEIYFNCIHKLLKPQGGIGVFQCITMPEARYEAYSKGEDFIRKYIFPGGHLPTITQLVGSIERGSAGALVVDEVYNIGGHYAKTLRLWKEKFEMNFDCKIRPALLSEHEGMTGRDVDLFRRKWEYYFTYCEAGFNTKTLGDVILTVGREGAMEMLEGIPL